MHDLQDVRRLGLALPRALRFPNREAFDKAARDAVAAWQFPGMAVAVVQDDKVVFLKAYGAKEIGKPEPVTVDTLFQIGSTTKAFTTTAMAMLVDEKKLDWDDPVHQH